MPAQLSSDLGPPACPDMGRRVRLLSLATILAFAAHGTAAPVAVTPRRAGSGPLPLSVQNEAQAACDRARTWLTARQNDDGSWGLSNRVALTAVALVALTGEPAAAVPAGVRDRGCRWLLAPPPDDVARASPEARAWQAIALSLSDGGVATTAAVQRLAAGFIAEAGPAASNLLTAAAIREALALAGRPTPDALRLPPTPPVPADLPHRCAWEATDPNVAAGGATAATLTGVWGRHGPPKTPDLGANRVRWILARFINRQLDGVLSAGDAAPRIDWRVDLALELTATQRIDPRRAGAGYWPATPSAPDWAADPVAETAFGLLTLREL